MPKYAAAGIVVTEIATPTPALACVSIASIPAMPAKRATTIVSSPTVAKPCRTVSSRSKPVGSRSSWSCTSANSAATMPATASPTTSVSSARRASFRSRPTKPTAIAAIGNRSGLTAIAPTMSIGLRSMTP